MNQNLYNVNFQQLDVFLSVVETNSFTKTAGILHMTQSAVSKIIDKLEQRLDLQLFTRDHKNLYLTEAGHELYGIVKEYSEKLSVEYDQIWALQHEQKSTLQIGIVNNTDLELYFWPLWNNFRRRFPEADAEYHTEPISQMTAQLLSRQLDLLFVPDFMAERLEQLNLPWKWAAKDYVRIIMPKGHRLEKKALTFETIKDEPIVLLSDEETHNLRFMKTLFEEKGYSLKIGKQYSSPENICRFYTGKDGLLFTDVFFDCSHFHEKIVKRSFKEAEAGIIVSWNPKVNNEYIRNFVEMIP